MRGYVLIAQGDLTRLSADAVAYSADRGLTSSGQLTSAFVEHVPAFSAQYEALGRRHRGRPPAVGEAFWLPLDTPKPRGVVVTVASGADLPRAECARRAVHSALRCAIENLERLAVPRPWLVALPAFLTGEGGARRDRLAIAEPQIEAALDVVAEHPDLDVAFVPFTEDTYQLWLEARRRVLDRRHAPPCSVEPPEGLVRALRRRECVLFVGAGVSTGSGLPGWHALSEGLADELGIPRESRRADLDYYLDLAQWYRDQMGEAPLLERIKGSFTVEGSAARPTLAHYLLTSLPVRHLVTTNYDDLLETALEALRRWPKRIVSEADVARTGGADGCYVVKFHGCAHTGQEIVLSRDDYDGFLRRRPAMSLLLEGLLLNQTFFFVGYGLRDPDFRHVYHHIAEILREAKRPAYATTFEVTTDHPRRQWKNKQLDLLDVPGADAPEKIRRLDRFLDRLGERVAEDTNLFLAESTEQPRPPAIERVRHGLLEVAEALEAACRAERTSPSDAAALRAILRLVSSLGFRGHRPGGLGVMFEQLAAQPQLDDEERRSLLASALRHSESLHDAERLRATLEATDDPTPPK